MNRILIGLILSVVSISALSWDADALVGNWELYSYQHENVYKRLAISDEFSGYYLHMHGNDDPIIIPFTKEQVRFFDGYAVIEFKEPIRLMISAWGSRAEGNAKRLLGQLFLYSEDNEGLSLFNSIPLSMNEVSDGGLIEFTKDIKGAVDKAIANNAVEKDAQ